MNQDIVDEILKDTLKVKAGERAPQYIYDLTVAIELAQESNGNVFLDELNNRLNTKFKQDAKHLIKKEILKPLLDHKNQPVEIEGVPVYRITELALLSENLLETFAQDYTESWNSLNPAQQNNLIKLSTSPTMQGIFHDSINPEIYMINFNSSTDLKSFENVGFIEKAEDSDNYNWSSSALYWLEHKAQEITFIASQKESILAMAE